MIREATGQGAQEAAPTCQVCTGPPSQLAGLAGELVLHVLILFAGCADPAAAHLSFANDL